MRLCTVFLSCVQSLQHHPITSRACTVHEAYMQVMHGLETLVIIVLHTDLSLNVATLRVAKCHLGLHESGLHLGSDQILRRRVSESHRRKQVIPLLLFQVALPAANGSGI